MGVGKDASGKALQSRRQFARYRKMGLILTVFLRKAPVLLLLVRAFCGRVDSLATFTMTDFIYIAVTLGFFLISAFYARFCETL